LHAPNFNRFWLIHPCDRQRDRRTRGQAIAYSALCCRALKILDITFKACLLVSTFVIQQNEQLIHAIKRLRQQGVNKEALKAIWAMSAPIYLMMLIRCAKLHCVSKKGPNFETV